MLTPFDLAMQRGFEAIEADVSEFIKAGGACKCLTLEI
jgi:N-dimethylarginine dimethylaminohydrolase